MTMTRTARLSLCLAALAALLTACGSEVDEDRSLLERFNVARGGPDEFLVIERAPIQFPTDLRELPPPRAGAVSRVEPQVDALVASAFGTASINTAATNATGGELAFLRAAGASDVPEGTRALIEAEHEARVAAGAASEGLFDVLLPSARNPYREDQIDPVEEVIRLRRAYPGIVTPAAPLDEETQ